MRVLTVRQPWAWAIVQGRKDVENRSRNVAGSYRGPVAIHAGLAPFEKDNMASRAHREAREAATEIVFGGIVGVVDLVGVHVCVSAAGCMPDPADHGRWALCSPWAEPGGYHLVLANARPLARAVQWRGALGLRELPDDVAAAVEREVRS